MDTWSSANPRDCSGGGREEEAAWEEGRRRPPMQTKAVGMSDDDFVDGEVVDEKDEDKDAGGGVRPAQLSSLQRATRSAAK